MTAVIIPTVLFLLFAFLSAVGAYFLTAHYRGRTGGLVAALLTLVFFVLLYLGLLLLMREMPGAPFAFFRTR